MNCTIQWHDTITRAKWNELLSRCSHTTILQSYYYAQAMREVHQQGVCHGVIMIDGAESGIVQMQEVKLFGRAIHILSIDRGPLWFDGFGDEKHMLAFSEALNTAFPARFGRKRRFLPEFQSKNDNFCIKNWKIDEKIQKYRTFIVSLGIETDKIRQNLQQKWRNILNKAEKSGLNVDIDQNCETLSNFLAYYIKDRAHKSYAGASPKFLTALAKYAAMDEACFILNAMDQKTCIASVMIFTHGKGGTYQAGWTTDAGRKKGAHHLLLWRGIELLKTHGVTHFDLGGHHDDKTPGLKKFKTGLGGHEIALVGSYS